MNVYKQVGGAQSIDIRGAKGSNAISINGTYDPTDEVCNDMPVYQKRGDPNKWMEYFTQSKKWYIKATTDRGKARGWLRLTADPAVTPEKCDGNCEVWDGSKWTSQPTVNIVTAKQRHEDDLKHGSLRRIRATPVRITGATGPSGPSINGIYEPTEECCGGWPVYRKKDDPEKWLEYNVASQEWFVKPTTDRGKPEGWLCIASDPPTRPELTKGTCDVWDGERWIAQNTVVIKPLPGYFRGMTEVQIFCTEEIKKSHEKLTNTLNKAIKILQASIPPEKIAEGTMQLAAMNSDYDRQLQILRKKRDEEKERESQEQQREMPEHHRDLGEYDEEDDDDDDDLDDDEDDEDDDEDDDGVFDDDDDEHVHDAKVKAAIAAASAQSKNGAVFASTLAAAAAAEAATAAAAVAESK